MKKERTYTYREAFKEFLTPRNLRGLYPTKTDMCHLCGRKSTGMRGIAILDGIRVKNAKTKPEMVECFGPECYMYLCPKCHHNVWGIFFELWDAFANGPKKPLLKWGFDRTLETVHKLEQKRKKMEARGMNAWLENGDPDQYKKMVEDYESRKAAFDKKYPHDEEGKRVVCRSLTEIGEMPFPPSKVSYDFYGIKLHVYGLHGSYSIGWWQIEMNFKDVGDWVTTLSYKKWCDNALIRDFIACVWDHYKLKEPKFLD